MNMVELQGLSMHDSLGDTRIDMPPSTASAACRPGRIRRSEYGLLALLSSVPPERRLQLSADGLYWTGALTALDVSAISLGLGARYVLQQMRIAPAQLLRAGA